MRLLLVTMALLFAAGCSSSAPPKKGPITNAVNVMRGKTPVKAVLMMEDPSSADRRREGIYLLVENDFGQSEKYCARYRQIAQSDGDWTVRAAAIRALNWSRDKNAVPVFIAALGDKSEMVRWQAAKALVNVPDASAVGPLATVIGSANESRDVRIAAVEALRHHKNLAAARALVGTLSGKDFGVAWHARRSLRAITGVDHQYDERAWLEYLTTSKLS
jgi:HEAT repeat protein